MVVVWVGGPNITISFPRGLRGPSKLVNLKPIRKLVCHMTSSSFHHLVKVLLVEGTRVGGEGNGGLFRELVPNLVFVHPLSNCRDTYGYGREA